MLLLFEENPDEARRILAMLSAEGEKCDAQWVSDWSQVVAKLDQEGIQSLLLSLTNVQRDDLKKIRALQEQYPGVAVVVLAAEADWETSLEALQAGAQDCLVKSQIDTDRLAHSIRYAIERQRVRSEFRKPELAVSESEERYRKIFQNVAISIWEQDFSWAKKAIDDLKSQGVNDFAGYFRAHPEFVQECIRRTTILDVNDAGVRLYGAKTKQELLDSLEKVLLPETAENFRKVLQAIAEGQTFFEGETVNRTLQNERLNVLVSIAFPGEDDKFDRVLVSVQDITPRKRIEAEVEARIRQQAVVAGLGQQALATKDLSALMQQVAFLVAVTLNVEYCKILELLPDGNALRVVAGVGWQKGVVGNALVSAAYDSQAGYTLVVDAPVIVEDFETETRFKAPQLLVDHGVVSGISVIIRGGEQPYGVLGVHSKRPRSFAKDDMNFLQAIANVLSEAITRHRIESERERLLVSEREQRKLAEALRDTAHALNSTLDFEQVLDRILQNVDSVVPYETATIMLLEDQKTRVVRQRGYEAFDLETWIESVEFDLEELETLKEMAETRQPIWIEDTKDDPRWIHLRSRVRSYVGAPIATQQEVLGFLNLNSSQPAFFNRVHAERLLAFADQVAFALQNARLFRETRRRAEETAALLTTTRAMSTLEIEAVLETIAEQAKSLFAADGSRIHLIEPDGETLRCVVAFHDHAEEVMHLPLKLGEGISGHVALTGEAEIVHQTLGDERGIQVPGTPVEPESLALAPLKARGRVIGVMTVSRLGEENPFNPHDLELITAFAEQASVAIENARLFEATSGYARYLELLNRITATVLASQDLDTMLRTLADQMGKILEADACYIVEWDEVNNRVIPKAASGPQRENYANLRVEPGEVTLTEAVLRAGHPLAVEDVFNSPYISRRVADKFPSRSILGLPLIADGKKLGAALIAFDTPHRFTEDEIERAQQAAAQLSMAIAKMRLLEHVRKQAEEREALLVLSESMRAASTRAEIVPIILEHTMALLDTGDAGLALRDPNTGETVLELGCGVWAERTGERQPPGIGIGGYVIQTGEPFIRDDVRQNSPVLFPELVKDIPATACVPLSVGDETIGALWIGRSRAIDNNAVHLLTTIANMAANAFHRLALREKLEEKLIELSRSNEELARLYRSSVSLITGSTVDIQKLAQNIVEIVRSELGESSCSLFLLKEGTNEIERIAASGAYSYPEEASRGKVTLDGEGLVPQAMRLGKIINVPDVLKETHYVPDWKDARSEMVIPLMVGDQVIGAIDVQCASPAAFDPDDERLMSIFAERAALTLEHARLYQQTEKRLRRLDALRNIDIAISANIDLGVTLNVLLDQVTAQLEVDASAILLLNPHTQTLEYKTGRGFHTPRIQESVVPLGEGYAGRAALERRMLSIPDINAASEFGRIKLMSVENFKAYFGIPLIAKGQIKGVLEIFHRSPFYPDVEWMEFLHSLAGQAAIAIENALLFEGLQRSNIELTLAYDETIEAWARVLDLRDQETEGHSQRVTEMSIKLARELGFTGQALMHLRRGALLHDIGKMGVPDRILHKPGPLSAEEWEIMRKHPLYAYQMLSSIKFLRPALDIPYCHHEKWDGSGYPRGLKGEHIPKSARIFAVVDVWDALSSVRPYRDAWPREKILAYMREQSGKHFDPQILEVFLEKVAPKA